MMRWRLTIMAPKGTSATGAAQKADDDQATVQVQAFEVVCKVGGAYWIENDVHGAARPFAHRIHEAAVVAVEAGACAEFRAAGDL